MARVNYVKAARKANPVAKKGQPYYWWKFRHGAKQFSKTAPKPSQLTSSPFMQSVLGALESLEELDGSSGAEVVKDTLSSAADEIREAGDQAEESRNNMPECLQDGPTGEMLASRKESCDELADQLQELADNLAEDADEDDVQAATEEAQALSYDGE